MSRIFALLALSPIVAITSLGACSGQRSDSEPTSEAANASGASAQSALDAVVSPTAAVQFGDAAGPGAGGRVLTLSGLGTLLFDQAPPGDGPWSERGAQASDTCRVITSADYPGVYAITEGGKVRRITAGASSNVTSIEGIGVGSTRAQVNDAFPGFQETPHKYVAGAKYLTTPGAENGRPAVRLEMSPQGKVTAIHIGMMPTLGYVEACS
ncbi:hypothetical protein [Novosphingobium aquae]|uniref:Secreted protein n=1 Tax=Novosphingobium aquae TaxID=3133435 RepID=A0ABU8SBN0_9SPHN